MSKNASLMKRLIGKHKPVKRVFAFDRYELMTLTQACRFRELQESDTADLGVRTATFADRPWYTLAEAARRLELEPGELLKSAAAGKLRCYLHVNGLSGRWTPAAPGDGSPATDHLVLPADVCCEIETAGSANVSVLEYHPDEGDPAYFRLDEVQWVDPGLVVIRHPLPANLVERG